MLVRKRLLILASLFILIMLVGISIASAGGRPLHADLSFDNEVPPTTGTAATGSAFVTLNQGQGEVCFDITTSGLSGGVTGAHIHVGEAGVPGGVVVSLTAAYPSGCVDADGALIKAIRKNPGGYYINVHTTAVGSGEVRGQLSK